MSATKLSKFFLLMDFKLSARSAFKLPVHTKFYKNIYAKKSCYLALEIRKFYFRNYIKK